MPGPSISKKPLKKDNTTSKKNNSVVRKGKPRVEIEYEMEVESPQKISSLN